MKNIDHVTVCFSYTKSLTEKIQYILKSRHLTSTIHEEVGFQIVSLHVLALKSAYRRFPLF